MQQSTTWEGRLYFSSEGRHAEDLNQRTRVPEATTLTPRPPEPLALYYIILIIKEVTEFCKIHFVFFLVGL